MSEKKVVTVTLGQIADALEERQVSDRRKGKEKSKLPEGVNGDRRREDRRAARAKKNDR